MHLSEREVFIVVNDLVVHLQRRQRSLRVHHMGSEPGLSVVMGPFYMYLAAAGILAVAAAVEKMTMLTTSILLPAYFLHK